MKVIKTAGVILGLVAVLALGLGTAALAGDHPPGGDKVYICHASGQAGTTKFETLYLPPAGVAAHFKDNGTPQAGHELDYFGPCSEEPPPTDYCDTLPGVQGEDEDCPPPVTQPIEVTAGVTFTEATCTTGPSFHLVKSTGVPFYDVEGPLVDGKPVAGGTYTITALPAEGYVVVGQSVWVHTFAAAPTDCGGTPPPPRLCPDGKPPTPGEGAYDPNDDCARPPAPPVTTSTPPATVVPPAVVPPTTTTTPAATTPVTTTPATKPKAPKPPKTVAPKPKTPKPDKPPVKKAKSKHVCKTIVYTDSNGKVWTTPRKWVDGQGCVGKIQGSG